MANLHVFLMSAIFVVIVSLLPSLLVPVEAKFSLSGLSSDVLSSQSLNSFRLLAETATTPFGHHGRDANGRVIGHHNHKNDPCKPAELAGRHALGKGHHKQANGQPCVPRKVIPNPRPSVPPFGHHPPGVGHHGSKSGHHPPGVGHHGFGKGHHPPGVGHHPPGVGHHCDNNATICLFPPTPAGSTTCCGRSCINLETNPSNCGSCGHLCPTGNGCCGGVCTDFKTDAKHCGSCTNVCAPGVTCSFGMCGYV